MISDVDFYNIQMSYYWTQAVILQAQRIIDLAKRQNKEFFDTFRYPLDRPEYFLDNEEYKRIMEEHFFILAVGKSIDFYKSNSDKFKKIISKIETKIGIQNITDIRNMREHDDEYISKQGRKQSRFIIANENISTEADATGTGIDLDKKQYWLGARVNIFTVAELYEEILTKVKRIRDEFNKNYFANMQVNKSFYF
jgi:hypothetical protein